MRHGDGQRCDSEKCHRANPQQLFRVPLLNVRQFVRNHEVELSAVQPMDTDICHSYESRPTMGIHQLTPTSRIHEDTTQMYTHLSRNCERTLEQLARLNQPRSQSFSRQETCFRKDGEKARSRDPQNASQPPIVNGINSCS